jgi:transcriptional regulator with XRE-family HTH domain
MELAEAIGVSYQQIQKYEKEKTQLTLGRFFLIAKTLDTPIQAFFTERRAAHLSEKRGEYSAAEPVEAVIPRDERILLRVFRGIADPRVKRSILRLVQSIAEQQKNPE